MAALTLGTTTYAIAPFRLRELRKAAPYIDRLSVEAVAETAADMLAVLAVGMADASLETLQAQAGLGDLEAVREAFDQVVAEAGLTRPEPSPGEAGGTAAPVP